MEIGTVRMQEKHVGIKDNSGEINIEYKGIAREHRGRTRGTQDRY